MPLIVAHRGLLRYAPENTLSNFRACLELRLGFELDVQKTKDGKLICIHDTTVNRTTNGKGAIASLTLQQIQSLDAGEWFDAKFRNEKVPTIEEVFKLIAEYRHHPILIAVDIKVNNVEEDLIRIARKHNILDRLLFIGKTISEPEVRKKLLKASTKAQVAQLANTPKELPIALKSSDASWAYVRFLPTRDQIDMAKKAGKKVFIAGPTVSGDRPQNWTRAAKVGINAILTDYPLKLRTSLRDKAKASKKK